MTYCSGLSIFLHGTDKTFNMILIKNKQFIAFQSEIENPYSSIT